MRVEYREEPCKTALNRVRGMGFDWSLNPYTGCAHRCAFCYVRAFERRADRPADARYGWSIRVKLNVARVLQHAARRARVGVHFSVPTLDPGVWQATEPGTAPPLQRLRALRMLIDAGIDAGVGMAPILPGVSDRPEQLEAVIRAARDAGATRIWANLLYLRPGTREHFLETLDRHWPQERTRYESLYAGRAYLPKSESEALAAQVKALRARHAIADRRTSPLRPPPEAVQLDMAI